MMYFAMDLDTAEEFYKRVLYKEAVTEKEKADILVGLIDEGRIQVFGKTDIPHDEFIAELGRCARTLVVRRGKL